MIGKAGGRKETLAAKVFPATYRPLLSEEQVAFMMERMYSPESLHRQMEEGHIFFITEQDSLPAGYLSIQPEDKDLPLRQKLYVLPACRGTELGRQPFRHATASILPPAAWSCM